MVTWNWKKDQMRNFNKLLNHHRIFYIATMAAISQKLSSETHDKGKRFCCFFINIILVHSQNGNEGMTASEWVHLFRNHDTNKKKEKNGSKGKLRTVYGFIRDMPCIIIILYGFQNEIARVFLLEVHRQRWVGRRPKGDCANWNLNTTIKKRFFSAAKRLIDWWDKYCPI